MVYLGSFAVYRITKKLLLPKQRLK